MPKVLQIHLLGSFNIILDGKPVRGLDSPRLQSFLSYLILHRDAPQSRQQLAFLFWPDSNESQARTNLRNMLFKLRGAFPEVDDYLEVNQQTLWWKPETNLQLDLAVYQQAVEHSDLTGSAKDQKAHRQALTAVTQVYPGDLLPSCYDDWIQPERERLKQSYIQLLEELVGILEADGDIDQAILSTRQLIRRDNIAERYYQTLIGLYISKGNKAQAVRTYHQCVEILEKEMGFDPSSETQKLYKQIMAREESAAEIHRVSEKKTRLIGRSKSWNELQEAWLGYQSGGHMVVIMGEAGIGKSYLADEFFRWAKKGNITCLKTRSYPTEDELAYTPLTGLLRNENAFKKISQLEETRLIELARLLPELRAQYPDLPDPERISESWKRGRLFEAAAHSLLGLDNKLVVLLDDLQWCDRGTLDWLRYILAYETEKKFMIIAGVRTEELLADSLLIPFFGELGGKGKITEVLLERLDLDQTHRLASDMWGEDLEKRAALRLFQETEGNPLFIAEMVRAGYLKDFGDGTDLSKMPPKVQSVIESRLNALSPKTRDVAAAASAVGREFDFELLFRTGNLPETDLLAGLDELWSRRLIRDEGETGYNFSHDKFREILYGELSPHRRVHYHKKVARALEEIHADQLEVVAPQLAFQFNQAGDKDQALDYYLMAGDQARLVFAQGDALAYYQSAEKIGWKEKDSRPVALYSGMGKTLLRLARYDESVAAYFNMSQTANSIKDSEREAQSWLAVATVYDRLGKFKEALESTAKAEDIANKSNCPKEEANAYLMKGQQFYRLGDINQAELLLNKALDMHQDRGEQIGVGRCLNLLGLIADVRGDFPTARKHKNNAIAIFEEINDTLSRWWIGKITGNLANTASLIGDYQQAVVLYQKALEIMEEFGDRDWKLLNLFSLGAAQVGLGEYAEAENYLGEVLEITEGSGWLGLSLTYYFLAESYLGQGQLKYAEKAAQEAMDLGIQTGAQEHLGAAWRALGKVASEKARSVEVIGEPYSAEQCFDKSAEIFREVGADDELALTLRPWARYELENGDKEKGDKLWQEAKDIFQRLDMPAELERMEKGK